MADAEQTNADLTDALEKKQEYILEVEKTNWLLRQHPERTGVSVQPDYYDPDYDTSVQPDYEGTRDRTLNKLKIGKQSTAGKAIDAFIKELKHGL